MSDQERRPAGHQPERTGCPECDGYGYDIFQTNRAPFIELQGIDACTCAEDRTCVGRDDGAAIAFVRDLEHGDPFAFRCALALLGVSLEGAPVRIQPDPLRELVSACRLIVHGEAFEKPKGMRRLENILHNFDDLEV